MLLSISARLEHAQLLAELGYEAIDVDFCHVITRGPQHEPILDGDNWPQQVDAARDKCEKLGLKLHTCHLPFKYRFVEPTENTFAYCHQMACRALQAAQRLGIRWAVMHIDKVDKEPERVIAETVAYAKKLFSDSDVTKTGIAIENSTSTKTIEEAVRIHDILREDGHDVCFCLDVGHCHINRTCENHVPSVVRQLGDRLKMLHLHDNCRNSDLHAAPFAGTLPWEETMVALKEVGYAGDFNLEIDFGRVPAPLLKTYLQYSADVSRYLMSVFHNA